MKEFSPDRRKFLKLGTAVVGSGLVLGVSWSCSEQSDAPSTVESGSFSPNAWLRLESDGSVTIIVAESEMGQGTYTSLPMIVAEELEVDWNRVRVEHASLDPAYGYQMTGGSSSIRKSWSSLREAGAITRELLISAAAAVFTVPAGECKAFQGKVLHSRSNQEIAYERLIETASKLPIPDKAYLKEFEEFTIIGQTVSRLDIGEKVNGKARFGIDTKLPEMLYATITHSPVFGGTVKHVDDTSAKNIKGIKDILQIDEGVVVVASDTWTAIKATKSLKIDWDEGDKQNLTSDAIINKLRDGNTDDAKTIWKRGDISRGFSGKKTSIEAEYLQPFQAHVPMEPMNCTAHFTDNGKLNVWAPTQSPSAARNSAQNVTQSKIERGLRKVQKKLLGIHDTGIDVHTTLLGGGFGRRLNQDYVTEVVKIAQHYNKPVQLVWTREEDVQHDYYHPLTLHKMKGALDSNGLPVAWEHYITGHRASGGGAGNLPYQIPHARVLLQKHNAIIPKGSWRSVSAHYNVFAVEHFLDELAWAGKNDPVELRLRLLKSKPRHHICFRESR